MGLYDADFSQQTLNLIPPNKRNKITLAFLGVYAAEFQYLRDLLFDTRANGFSGAIWSAGAYTLGQRVRYIDRSVYEVVVASTSATPGTSTDWLKIQNIWIGSRERIKYNGKKLLLEYILNKWFDTVFRQPTAYTAATPDATAYYTPKSDIFITNTALVNNVFRVGITESESSFVSISEAEAVDAVFDDYSFSATSFTINVPVAVWTALGADAPTRDGAIRALADKYVIAGILYKIVTY